MLLQLTDAGRALIDSDPIGVVITRCDFGNGFNYALPSNPTGLTGTLTYSGNVAWEPVVVDANTLRYSLFMAAALPSFSFGEFALYNFTTLVGVAVNSVIINKIGPGSGNSGEDMRLECYIGTTTGQNYAVVDTVASRMTNVFPRFSVPDYLVPPSLNENNVYLIYGTRETDVPYLAFSDPTGKWGFSGKPVKYYEGVVSAFGTYGIEYSTLTGVYVGDDTELVIQFVSGVARGYCRQVTAMTLDGVEWNTAFVGSIVPEAGDEFVIMGPPGYSGAVSGALERDVLVIGTDVGAVDEGFTFLEGTTFTEFVELVSQRTIPPTYLAPTLVLASSPTPTNTEVGTNLSLQETMTFTQRDGGALTERRLYKNAVLLATDTSPYTDNPVQMTLSTITYQAQADYAQGPIKNDNRGNPDPTGRIPAGTVSSNSIVFVGKRKAFYGTPVSTPGTSAAVRAMSDSSFNAANNADVNASGVNLVPAPTPSFIITIPIGADRVVFAYPADQRDVASVRYQELSDSEVKGNFTMTTVSVEGANSFTAVNYKVWTYIPVEPFSVENHYKVFI
jgi:hypothetical protein